MMYVSTQADVLTIILHIATSINITRIREYLPPFWVLKVTRPDRASRNRKGGHLRMSEAEAKRPEARRVERVMAPLVPDGHEHDDDG